MNLPLIDFASLLFDNEELNDCYIIGVQHILPSTFLMFQALIRMGLKKENISLLGKCYSTNIDTFENMRKCGIDVSKLSTKFDSHEHYDIAFKKKIHNFLTKRKNKINSSKYKKIIIIDDGGELLEEAEKYIDDFSKIVAIEQTSSGYNRLKNKKLPFSIINLARSEAKLKVEYPRVIKNALDRINNVIKSSKRTVKKILILGNGNMGSALFKTLKSKYQVLRYDRNLEISDLNEKTLKTALSQADLIIGCSGKISLKKDLHNHLKENVMLVSLSSSDREFDTVHLRKKNPKTNNPWNNISCENVILINNGFPISFDNNKMDDSYFFQFTRSLIMSSIYQALNTDSSIKGFIDLDETLQEKMLQRFEEYRKVNSYV